MKRISHILFLLLAGYFPTSAQQRLVIQGVSPSFFLQHTVAPKENWYQIGRTYNLPPKDLAAFNKLTMEQTLPIGKILQIPLNELNFTQLTSAASGEALVPLYHNVQEKEWMFRISQLYNKIPVSQLEKMNGITSAQIKAGMWLIVGYLKVRTDQSAGPKVTTNEKEESRVYANNNTDSSAQQPVKNNTGATDTGQRQLTDSVNLSATGTPSGNKPIPASHMGGVFKKYYKEEGKKMEGNAGVFKSSSGWEDGKYYALISNIPVGTIIQITFLSTNKSIYAKVLGQLPEMKESQGLSLRISDAAASELGSDIGKFYVEIRY